MKKKPRRLRRILYGLVGFLLLLFVAWLFRWPLLGGTIRRELAGALEEQGIRLHVGELSGSLLTNIEARGVRAEPITEGHLIEEASIERVHLSFSVADLLRGEEEWLGDVRIEGLRVLADLEGEFPTTEPDPERADIAPATVRVSDAAITVLSGENVLTVTAGFASVLRDTEGEWSGIAGAERIAATVEGKSYEMATPQVEVTVGDGFVAIGDSLTRNAGGQHLRVAFAENGATGEMDLQIFGGRVSGRLGSDGDRITANLDIEDLEPAPLLAFVPGIRIRCESISGKVTASWASGQDLPAGTFDLKLASPVVEDHAAASLETRGSLEGGVLEASGEIRGPDVRFEGKLHLDDRMAVEGRATFARLDIEDLRLRAAQRIPAGLATGTATIRGSLASPLFTLDAAIESPSLGEHHADHLAIEASGTLEDLDVRNLVLSRGDTELTARGVLILDDPLAFSGVAVLSIPSLSLAADLVPADLPEDLDGALVIGITATGTPDRPFAEVTLSGQDLTVADVHAKSLEVVFDVPDFRRITARELAAKSAWIEIEGRDIDVGIPTAGQDIEEMTIDGMVTIHHLPFADFAEFLEIDAISDCELAGRLGVAGPIRNLRGDLILRAGEMACRIPGRDEVIAHGIEIRGTYADRELILNHLEFGGEGWKLTASGRVESDPLRASEAEFEAAPLSGRVRMENSPLELSGPIPGIVTANGTVTADLTISGSFEKPMANGEMEVIAEKIVPRKSELPPFTDVRFKTGVADFGPNGGILSIHSLTALSAGSAITIRELSSRLHLDPIGLKDLRLDATVADVDIPRWADHFGVPQIIDGRMDLHLTVTEGPVLGVKVDGEGIVVRTPSLILEPTVFDRLEIEAGWKKGLLTVSRAELRSADRRIRVGASIPILLGLDPLSAELDRDRPLDVTVNGEGLDLAALSERRGGLRLEGNAAVKLTARGLPGAMRFGGEVRWTDGHLRYPGSPSLDGIDGRFRLEESRIVIEKFTAQAGRGNLDLGGSISLGRDAADAVMLTGVDLALKADRALLLRDDDVMLRADLDLAVRGGGQEPFLLKGDVGIVSLRYTENIEFVTSRPSLAQLPLTEDRLIGPSRLDLNVTAPRGTIKIRNNLVNADLGGDLRVRGTCAMPRPAGRIVADRGSVRLPAITMNVSSAILQFVPQQPLRPRIEAHLSARVGRVSADAYIRGTADSLEITASSVPPMPSEDVVTLLATGELPANLGAASAATVATTILYRQLVSEFTDGEDEDSMIADLASRVEEVSVDTGSASNNGFPAWRATIRLVDEFLYLRADQVDAFDYGLDLLFRLSFR